MALRDNPYGAFNFMVKLGDTGGEDQIAGGFSDFSGAGNEVKFSEYRNGNDQENHVRKIANTNTTDDVTLKRGIIGDLRLFDWLKATREGDLRPAHGHRHPARRGARTRSASGCCGRPSPRSGSGPTLAAKGGGEVAMEELHLVAERIDFASL